MPTYRIHVKQYAEEIAEQDVEARSAEEARQMVEDGEVDFDWQDGNETGDLEITKIEIIDGEEPEGEEDPDSELET